MVRQLADGTRTLIITLCVLNKHARFIFECNVTT
jgi:hypothetical protein